MGLETGRYGPEDDDRITPGIRERADEHMAEAMKDVRAQLRQTFEVAINSCETIEELFMLKDLSIALNGLLLSEKRHNG